MSEMLGNQYFMARNYFAAESELGYSLAIDPTNKSILKRITVCYTQTGKIDKALNTFLSLISNDIDFVANTDPVSEDCPCQELITKLQSSDKINFNPLDYYLAMGILWFYCDSQESYSFFKSAFAMRPSDARIKQCLRLINEYISKGNTGEN
jgi:tetratricopeptide (TPR) repeat protein